MARRRSTPRARSRPAPQRLILDAGAVLALAQSDRRARGFVARARELGADVVVPAVVVAETARGSGPRDAPVNRVLKAVGEVPAATEPTARLAGRLLAAAASNATIDALVVAEAVLGGGAAVVLTDDPDDLRALAGDRTSVDVQAV